MRTDDELRHYAASGMAAYLPGMVYMIEIMQRELDAMRARLVSLQEPRRKMGRPPKAIVGAKLASGWPADPEERSAEMKRRMQNRDSKRRQRAAKAVKPQTTELSKQRKKAWAALSPAKKKKRLAAMLAGKGKRIPVLKLEAAS